MLATSVVVIFNLVVGSFATDYCNPKLCNRGESHIGCNNNNKFASTCDSPSLVNFGRELQNVVLNMHNEYRGQIASGSTRFSPASRMPPLKWHAELAQLAEYNVRRCVMSHDQCRNTDSFPYVGQNLGYSATTARLTRETILSFIKKIQNNWYAESSFAQQAWLDKYTSNTNGRVIGHFTAMIQDHTTHIGCACATYTMKSGAIKFNTVLLACDYSCTNLVGYPVYTKGSTASRCITGRDTNYTSLCSLLEVISPTPV